MERTFIMIKPDGVQRGLISNIIGRFENKGFTLIGLKLMSVSRELAEKHYGVHKERPFFGALVEFIISSPVVAMVWEGDGVDFEYFQREEAGGALRRRRLLRRSMTRAPAMTMGKVGASRA